jgi:Ricin-type beta-trefoil lectin domain/Domain of unknown function (DUF4476)
LSQLKPGHAGDDFFEGHMTTSFKLTVLAAALAATTFAGTRAQAQGGRGLGRALPPPPGTGRLRNAAQGMCLDVAGWAAQGDGKVLLWECNDDPDHVWSFTRSGELRNALNGTCLDAAGYDGQQGANVDVYRCESMDDQRWKLVPRGRGTFELRNVKRGLCLDVNGRAGARGDNVLLWACDGGADQLWSFEAYAPRPQPPGPPPGPMTPPPPHRVRPGDPSPPMPELEVPPPPPRPRAMEEGAFRALVGNVRNESFADSQLTVVEQAAGRNWFRVGQIKSLIDLVPFSATKLRVLELCAPHIVDGENAFALYDAFTFSADKEQARHILRRHGI